MAAPVTPLALHGAVHYGLTGLNAIYRQSYNFTCKKFTPQTWRDSPTSPHLAQFCPSLLSLGAVAGLPSAVKPSFLASSWKWFLEFLPFDFCQAQSQVNSISMSIKAEIEISLISTLIQPAIHSPIHSHTLSEQSITHANWQLTIYKLFQDNWRLSTTLSQLDSSSVCQCLSRDYQLIYSALSSTTCSMSTRGLKHCRSLSTNVADVDTNCPTGLAPQVKYGTSDSGLRNLWMTNMKFYN